MKKRFFSLALALVMLLGLLPTGALAADITTVSTAEELKAFRDSVNGGNTYEGKTVTLTADIDLGCDAENKWTAIGVYYPAHPFKGTFDGGGHKITGLYVDDSAEGQGLFGYVGEGGTVKDLGVSGTVVGHRYVGGVAGYNKGSVTGCYNEGTIKKDDVSQPLAFGGVVGWSEGSVTGCYNTGFISGGDSAGGVVGYTYENATVTNCYNTGTVKGDGAGGVVGTNSGKTVEGCYNTGAVTATDDSGDGGGVVGYNSLISTTKNCYNTGRISGGRGVGGVVGYNQVSGTVENCYNAGKVSGGDHVGGVVGRNETLSTTTSIGIVRGCYYLTGTASKGLNGAAGEATEKTAEELQTQSTFVGWDFSSVWEMSATHARPALKAIPEPKPYTLAGFGEEFNPYRIRSLEDLKFFRSQVEGGVSYEGEFVRLETDLDLAGRDSDPWRPIGTSSRPFKGTFDGYGYDITDLYIPDGGSYQGLFGYLGAGGTVKSLEVTGSVSGKSDVGGVVGDSHGTVANCQFTGDIAGSNHVGGVVGYSAGVVTECSHDGAVNGRGEGVGGVVGYVHTDSSVTLCSHTGSVRGDAHVGGVVGDSYGAVENCGNTGTIVGDSYIGGVVGRPRVDAAVSNCYNAGEITNGNRANIYIGGVVGARFGAVKNCYYLEGTAEHGTGGLTISMDPYPDIKGQVEVKPAGVFASGELTHLLQGEQAKTAWGQTLSGNKADAYPVCTTNSRKQVYKVTFMNAAKEYAVQYRNNADARAIPDAPEKAGYTFKKWTTGKSGGTEFTAATALTADVTVYAQFAEIHTHANGVTFDQVLDTSVGSINGVTHYSAWIKDGGPTLTPNDGEDHGVLPAGNYRQDGREVLGFPLWVDHAAASFCLNGKELDASASPTVGFLVRNGGVLTMSDCKQTGTLSRTGGTVIRVDGSDTEVLGELIWEGGKLENTQSTDATSPKAAIENAGYVTLKGGEVTGPYAVELFFAGQSYAKAPLTLVGSPILNGGKADVQIDYTVSSGSPAACPVIDATAYTGDAVSVMFSGNAEDVLGKPIVKLGDTPAEKFICVASGYYLKEETVDGAKCLVLAKCAITQQPNRANGYAVTAPGASAYQWYSVTATGEAGEALASQTTAALSPVGLPAGTYLCRVTWPGGAALNSEAVTYHIHSWATAWTTDGTHHWHECTADGCDATENVHKNGYGAHSGGAATCAAKAVCSVCGQSYGELATHAWDKWTLQADGATLKRVCATDADHTETKALTVSVDSGSFTYNGTAKTPAVTLTAGTGEDAAALTPATDYTVTYSGNVNAGTGKITVTGQGDYSFTVTREFTIARATVPTATPGSLSITNKLEKEYTFTLARLLPLLNIEEYLETHKDWHAPHYEIKSVSFDIAGYYDGENAPATIARENGIAILHLPIQSVDTRGTGLVGTVTVTVTSVNYEPFDVTLNINATNKALVTFDGIVTADKTYDGQPFACTGTLAAKTADGTDVTASIPAENIEITYTGVDGTSYRGDPATPPSHAGSFAMIVQVADGDEHYIGTGLFPFQITKANGTASVTMADYAHGQTPGAPVPVSVTNSADGVSYTYKVKDADDGTYTTTVPTAAGTYTVRATFPEALNYHVVTAEADFTISHAATGGWQKDEAGHWKLCACGQAPEKTAHGYDDDRDATCNTCGYTRAVALYGTVSITGAARIGQTLTAAVSGAPEDVALQYAWTAAGSDTVLGMAAIYTPSTADLVGKTLICTVTTRDPHYAGSIQASAAQAVVKGDQAAPRRNMFTVTDVPVGGTTGSIAVTGDADKLEYRPVTDPATEVWTAVASANQLHAGIYEFRYKATATHNASLAAQVELRVLVPDGTVYGEVEVKGDTPEVTVDTESLKGLAGEIQEGDTVTVKLTAEKLAAPVDKAELEAIIQGRKDDVLYLELSLTKQINDQTPEAITDTGDKVLEIIVPYDFTGKKDVTVYRKHGSEPARALTKADAKVDGAFRLEGAGTNGKVYVYASQFSTYAIGYTAQTSTPVTPSRPVSKPQEETPVWPFTDVDANDWCYENVKYVYENKLMEGTSETTFAPGLTTSRAMIVTILYRLAGEPETKGELTYFDCAADSWYAKAVIWSTEHGVVQGYGDGSFGPENPITREQLAAMLYRFAKTEGKADVDNATEILRFADTGDVADWAKEAMTWAVDHGIITGKSGLLAPRGQATRAEAAAMLARYCQRGK